MCAAGNQAKVITGAWINVKTHALVSNAVPMVAAVIVEHVMQAKAVHQQAPVKPHLPVVAATSRL